MSDKVLLAGVVGSTAYGMATPESDVDRLGIYAVPTTRLHGLHPPGAKTSTKHSTSPDVTVHEVGKAASLLLAGNPTCLEILYLDDYETLTELGLEAIRIRSAFLAAPRVRAAYLGYATQQFKRLESAGRFPDVPVNRIAKHARHCARLCEQGSTLWSTGELPIRVKSPERIRGIGQQAADGDLSGVKTVLAAAEATFKEHRTALPDKPDEDAVEAWLQRVRREMWAEE